MSAGCSRTRERAAPLKAAACLLSINPYRGWMGGATPLTPPPGAPVALLWFFCVSCVRFSRFSFSLCHPPPTPTHFTPLPLPPLPLLPPVPSSHHALQRSVPHTHFLPLKSANLCVDLL